MAEFTLTTTDHYKNLVFSVTPLPTPGSLSHYPKVAGGRDEHKSGHMEVFMQMTENKQPFTRDEIATASPLAGVYVLYAGEKIVFIGCAPRSDPDGIRGRLAEHLHGVHDTEMSGLTHSQWATD